MMDVERRLRSIWFEHLDERVASVRLFACGLYGGQGGAQPPPRISFTFLEPEGLGHPSSSFINSSFPLSRPGLFPLGLMPKGPLFFTDHVVAR